MQPVTDPDLIEKLNAKAGKQQSGKTVVDPETIAKLNAKAALQRQQTVKQEEVKAEEKPGILETFFGDVMESYDKRRLEVSDTFTDWLNPELNQQVADITGQEAPRELGTAEAMTQIVGKGGFGAAWDVAGDTVIAGLKGISLIVPDDIEDSIKNEMSQGLQWIASSPKAQTALEAIKMGKEAYDAWATENPQDAKTLESVVNIGAAFVPGPKATPVTNAGKKAGQVFETIGNKITKKRMANIAEDLIDVSSSKKAMAQTLDNTTVTRFGNKVTALTPAQQKTVEALEKLPLKKQRLANAYYTENRTIIKDAIKTDSKKLDKLLERRKDTISDIDLRQQIRLDGGNTLRSNPMLQSDRTVAGQFQTVEDVAIKFLNENWNSLAGLNRARRKLDKWAERKRSERGLYGDGIDTAFSVAHNSVRRSMNKLISDKYGGKTVPKALNRMHQYYNALDVLDPKAFNEAQSTIGRLAQNVHNVTKMHLPTTPLAAIATVAGTAGVMSGFLPLMSAGLALGGSGAAIYKVAKSPKTYHAIDKAIRMSTNADMIQQLRLDRAALMEIAKSFDEEDE